MIEKAGVKALEVPDEYLLGKLSQRNDIVDKESGEITGGNANTELTEELLIRAVSGCWASSPA